MIVYDWIRQNGFRYNSPEGKGAIRRIYEECELYVHIEVYYRIFGKKHGSTWTNYLGKLYGWTTTKTTNSYNVVRLIGATEDSQRVFDVADVPLGGERETLG